MGMPLFLIDAFTSRPFAGNPAAVCLLPAARDAAWMQAVAAEMNLSETAFLVRQADGFNLRWFTPAVEVDLCGHATVASGHFLWESGQLPPEETARFHTRSGWLTATRRGDWIELDFPAKPAQQTTPPSDLFEALGIARARFVGKSSFDYLIELDDERMVRALKPDFNRLQKVEARGIIVTSTSATPEFDFVSRFFAPASGVNEDPVTGSAHCTLTPFWAARLGKSIMTGFQASKRGGVVRVTLQGERVLLGGQAFTVLRGELV